jgi:hypothetical protein
MSHWTQDRALRGSPSQSTTPQCRSADEYNQLSSPSCAGIFLANSSSERVFRCHHSLPSFRCLFFAGSSVRRRRSSSSLKPPTRFLSVSNPVVQYFRKQVFGVFCTLVLEQIHLFVMRELALLMIFVMRKLAMLTKPVEESGSSSAGKHAYDCPPPLSHSSAPPTVAVI